MTAHNLTFENHWAVIDRPYNRGLQPAMSSQPRIASSKSIRRTLNMNKNLYAVASVSGNLASGVCRSQTGATDKTVREALKILSNVRPGG